MARQPFISYSVVTSESQQSLVLAMLQGVKSHVSRVGVGFESSLQFKFPHVFQGVESHVYRVAGVSGGGVIPHIHKSLIGKKGEGTLPNA